MCAAPGCSAPRCSRSTSCSLSRCSSSSTADGSSVRRIRDWTVAVKRSCVMPRSTAPVSIPRRRATDGYWREGARASDRANQLCSGNAERNGAHVEASFRARYGDDSVSRGEMVALAAVAGNAPHAHNGGRQGEVRRLRSVPDGVPGELYQAGAWGGREGKPLSIAVRDRRVSLHLLRLLSGGVP